MTALILVLLSLALAVTLAWAAVLRKAVARGGYPSYLVTGTLVPDSVPVIMLHGVTWDRFNAELRYLKENAYETITPRQLADWLRGDPTPLPHRSVVLTFDDGHESLAAVAAPLLEKYQYRATAFVCPAWAEKPDFRAPARHLLEHTDRYASWDELRHIDAAGVIDVQSHSFDHHRVWVADRVIGFFSPQFKWPEVRWSDEHAQSDHPVPPLGWPILAYRPRFAAARRFLPQMAPMQACADHVARHGSLDFFRKPDWQSELHRVLGGRDGESHVAGRYESADEQSAAMSADLRGARELLSQRLNKSIDQLVFPWNEACPLAVSLAVSAGYSIILRGEINGRDVCSRGDDPLAIPRAYSGNVHEQFIRSLPGDGRRRVPAILLDKTLAALRR